MRTTLDIDSDVLQAAKEIAIMRKETAGKVLSDLARTTLMRTTPGLEEENAPEFVLEDGWYMMPSRGGIVTDELVRQLMEEADLEDAGLKKKV